MSPFLHGVVENVIENTIYEGTVYDRYIHLRLATGLIVPLFDNTELCLQLHIGKVYEMLAQVVVPDPLQVITPETSGKSDALWQGRIIDLQWRIPADGYFQLLSEDADGESDAVLTQTLHGLLLMSPQDILEVIKHPLAGETQLQWSRCRLDFWGARDADE